MENSDDPRVRLAGERTLLAWIRTGLAMMGFGFVVARFGLFLRELSAAARIHSPASSGLSLWIGTALVALGVMVNVLAAVQHLRFVQRLKRGEPQPASTWSLGIVISVLLAVLGLGMGVYLIAVGH
jgi:putative membrane protein